MHKKNFIVIIVVIIILFTINIKKYQQLVNEGSALADEHCIEVNPLIKQRKQAYIDLVNVMKNVPDSFPEANEKYLIASEEYLAKENNWLAKQKEYLNRWDVKLFLDNKTREVGIWQYKAYEADYRGTQALVRAFKSTDEEEQEMLAQAAIQATKDLVKAETEYANMWKNRKDSFDIRNYFVSIPPSNCPPENLNFPDVEQSILN